MNFPVPEKEKAPWRYLQSAIAFYGFDNTLDFPGCQHFVPGNMMQPVPVVLLKIIATHISLMCANNLLEN